MYIQIKKFNLKRCRATFIMLMFIIGPFIWMHAQDLSAYRWKPIDAKGEAKGRHENAFIQYDDKFYLVGGRGINPVNVFDPETYTWSEQGATPMEIHHFQAVVYQDAIYIMGAMTGGYPKEKPLANIWIYHPHEDKWEKGPEIPKELRRGGAGVVVYNDIFYMVCGIEYGHTSGTNNLFTSYNPATGEWKSLTKAPTIRDHFSAVVVNDKLYCIGGRNTSIHEPDNFTAFFGATNPHVDVYDFETAKWQTLENTIPVSTAAGGTVSMGDQIIYMGGESFQDKAHNETQILNTNTGQWSELAPMHTGRHGSHAILYKGKIYFAAGSPNRGGGNLNTIEVFTAD
ncbi:MAG: galactose oxidase [Bacteroidetes bacterium]|jgi:N-acetylneuraminic acid mutarotase|nr:galactose oxidase [Bacteroidota bacterium]